MSSDRLIAYAAWIEDAIKIAGGVAPLARAAGVSRGSIDNWRGGTVDPSLTNIIAVSDAVGLPAECLVAAKGAKLSGIIEEDKPSHPTVPRYDVALSAGSGAFPNGEAKLDEIPFTQEFLLKRLGRSNTGGLILVDVEGDSMAPTIDDGDLVMLDTNKTMLASAVFAFTYEDSLYIKRIQQLPDVIQVMSDNPIYAPFTLSGDQLTRLKVIGRVVWAGHTF